jgi:hypothetical protein
VTAEWKEGRMPWLVLILSMLAVPAVASSVPERDFWFDGIIWPRQPRFRDDFSGALIRCPDGRLVRVRPGEEIPGTGWLLVDIREEVRAGPSERVLVVQVRGGPVASLWQRKRKPGQMDWP